MYNRSRVHKYEECNIDKYNDQCLRSGKGKSSTERMELSFTAVIMLDEVEGKGGGFRRRTSSRQRRSSGDVEWVDSDDQPIIPSQRESLSSRPRDDNRAYISDEID